MANNGGRQGGGGGNGQMNEHVEFTVKVRIVGHLVRRRLSYTFEFPCRVPLEANSFIPGRSRLTLM